MALGRISGPLLKANLLREGVDLAFENDLLYLDVNNSRIGIKTNTPQYDLDVNGTARVPQLEVSTNANIADVTISGNTVSTTNPQLTLGTADTVVYQNKAQIDSIDIENNTISTNTTNENLEFAPNGTGTVEIFADTNVYGNIVATGSITADGNITIGDADTDDITINAEVASNIIPDASATYNLGSATKRWNQVFTNTLYADTISANDLLVDGIDLALRQGNMLYVAENGDDTLTGTHPNDPFATIQQALSVATAGDTIHIFPGLYQETFPMTVPAGVTVKGHSIRSVNITPTALSNTSTAFYLNGESTVEDITIKDFFAPGYAFAFNPTGITVTTRSPYIRNVSVITAGSVTSASDPRGYLQGDAGGGAYLDGELATAGSREAGCLFHSVTFIVPNADALSFTNGTRVEWLNSFTYFAQRGLYGFDSANGLKGTGQTQIRVTGGSGTFSAGETFTYYDTDGVSVLAQGTIDTVDADNKFYITGNLTGLTTAQDRGGKTIVRYQNPVTDTAKQKFGASSLQLDGTEDYIGVGSNNDFGFGTGDFTVESWIHPTSVTGTRVIADMRAGADTDTGLLLTMASGVASVYINGSTILTAGTTTMTTSTWYHVAVARSGTTIKLFINGNEEASATYSASMGTAKPLIIGAKYDGSGEFFEGNYDDFRVKKGTAQYTANFTAPTTQLVGDSATVLLLQFNNALDSSIEIIDNVTTSQDLRFSGGATADFVTLADKTDFGGELRSIASACVYGNYGAYGNGNGVLMYLISQNFAYIGTGKEVDNDVNDVVQTNEVTELSNAQIRFSSVDHNGDFRVGDLFYVNQKDGTINFTSADFNVNSQNGITIVDGSDVTTILGDQITTGNLKFAGNTISSVAGDINLDSATGHLKLTATGGLQLPKGTTAQRPGSPATGQIRYNTDTNMFEGYDGNWIALNGVYDLDLDTYITAENTPGANDDTIRMYVGGSERVNITSARLDTPRIEVDDIFVDGNVIGTITTDTDLNLSANGTGKVNIDDIGFKDSTITNNLADTALEFQQAGNGYFKIEGTGGFVVPSGTSIQRPLPAYRETGMIRFNTQEGYLEVFDGTSWVSVAGESGSITFAAAENLVIEYVLTLG